MRRVGIILSLSILMILMSFSLCFASGLKLIHSYPQDGSHDSMLENVVVKLYFNEDVSAKEVQEANKNAFKYTDDKGKEMPLRILYPKESKEIWVLVEKTLQPDSEYKLQISGELQIPNGDTLGQDQTIEFKTRDTGMDTTVNMGLMFVMVIGMIIFSSISAKRNLKKQEEESKADGKVNPYKVAKETGKSVEDVVAKTEKEKEKAKIQSEKKNKGKAGGKTTEKTTEKTSEAGSDTKRVTGPRPISVTGSTYLTGRKAKAEKEKEMAAAKAAAGTTRPKNATGKSRNKKAKGNKG